MLNGTEMLLQAKSYEFAPFLNPPSRQFSVPAEEPLVVTNYFQNMTWYQQLRPETWNLVTPERLP